MKDMHQLIEEHPFFEGLSTTHLDLIAGCAKNMHYKRDEYLIREGEDAEYFFIIRKGKVILEIDGAHRAKIQIQTLEDGDVMGWSWLIPPHVWRFSAKAVEETSAIALDGKCLRKKCEEDTELGYQLLKRFSRILANRLEWTRIQLLDLYN